MEKEASAKRSADIVRFSTLAPASRTLWAKSGNPAHGLLAHMLDVAAVAEKLLEFEPISTIEWAADQFGLAPRQLSRWIAAIVGLHDFGKAIPGFQRKWPVGMERDQAIGLEFPSHACTVTDHACATAALLCPELVNLTGADRRWIRHVILAVSAHHGFHFPQDQVNRAKPKGEPPSWKRARESMLQAYWQALAPEGAPAKEEVSLPALNWLAGLASTVDWIASNPDWFPPGERCDELRAYYVDALRRADIALQEINWPRSHTLLEQETGTSELLGRMLGRPDIVPRRLQDVGDHLVKEASGPALLLVEAPMGEGKTELAFLAHLRLQATNGHRGLYLALPTQATGNALFGRAHAFLKAFARGRTDLQLVHSAAYLNEDARHLKTIHLHGIDNSQEETVAASMWFSQRRRPLLSPYGVGTIDQALFSILNVRHHFVRLWGLGNRVVVLDEVHAYDTYTSGLIEVLLRWLKALGSSVVLMSATLPARRREELLAAWGADPKDVPDCAYPRAFLVDERGIRGAHFPARQLPAIQLGCVDEEVEALAELALSLLQPGGCGAVIVNTVKRAQDLYRLLNERLMPDCELLLFHARYPMDERLGREKKVLEWFGPCGKRPRRSLLVATQVAEQSLDLDFDFMISDLAPVDLLLQRAGRLHRHDRERPEVHREPHLWVAGAGPKFPDLDSTAWRFVYDAYILGRTWAMLQQEDVLEMPHDIDRLVQTVYGEESLPAELDAMVRRVIEIEAYGKYLAKMNKERQESRNVAIDPSGEPQTAYANKPRGNDEDDLLGLRNVTREGRETVTLVPVEVEVEAGGWRIGDVIFQPDGPIDDALARRLYGRHIRLSGKEIVNHFRGKGVPAAFACHPLLRNFHPLPLTRGAYEKEGIRLKLDAELGLVRESGSSAEEGE